MTYSEKLEDPRWQKKRLQIFERDEFTCQQCAATDKQLHVHHRYYISGRMPWEYLDTCFVTLCRDCHRKKREFEGVWEPWETSTDVLLQSGEKIASSLTESIVIVGAISKKPHTALLSEISDLVLDTESLYHTTKVVNQK